MAATLNILPMDAVAAEMPPMTAPAAAKATKLVMTAVTAKN